MPSDWTFEEATSLLNAGSTHEQLAKRYGYASHSGFTRRYNRLLQSKEQAVKLQYTSKKNEPVSIEGNHISAPQNDDRLEYHQNLTDYEIRRTAYGKLEPTFYREQFNDIDHLVSWIKTNTRYMRDSNEGNWDNTNTRSIVQTQFFDVFIDGFNTLVGRPREAGKSKVSTGIYSAIAANYYYPQSIIVNGAKSKNRIFNGLKYVFARNASFRRKYGDICKSMNRTEGHFEFKEDFLEILEKQGYVTDDPTIQISQYNGVVGSHPYVVWLEDMLQSEYKSDEPNEYMLYEVYDAIISKLANRKGGTFTRKGEDDLYSNLPSRGITLNTMPCIELVEGIYPTIDDLVINSEGVPIDVNIPVNSKFKIIERPGWTVKSILLDRTRALLDKRAFQKWTREMQNEIILLEGNYFSVDDWIEIEGIPLNLVDGACYVAVDPSFGESTAADFFCLLCGVVYDEKLHVRFAELHRGLTVDQQVWIIGFYKHWLHPKNIWVENKFGQVWLQQQANQQGLFFEPWNKKGDPVLKKTQRIDGLSIPFSSHQITMASNLSSNIKIPGHRCIAKMCGAGPSEVAFTQYKAYDQKESTADKKDDFPDTLATLYDKTKHYLKTPQWYTKTWN